MRIAEANSEHELVLVAMMSPPCPTCKRCKQGKVCLQCDHTYEEHREYAEEFSVTCGRAKNRPLSNKSNARSRLIKGIGWDYAIVMGSDDIVSPHFFDFYAGAIEAKMPLFGVSDLHILDDKKNLWYWKGYAHSYLGTPKERKAVNGHSVGAGRLIHRDVFERAKWKLWQDGKNKGLDATTHRILTKLRYEIPHVPMGGHMIVDVKDEESITKFDQFDPESLVKRTKPGWLRELLGASATCVLCNEPIQWGGGKKLCRRCI